MIKPITATNTVSKVNIESNEPMAYVMTFEPVVATYVRVVKLTLEAIAHTYGYVVGIISLWAKHRYRERKYF